MLIDKREDEGYVTPVESAGDSATYISRVRDDPTVDNGITLWCVSDNLRKGAALECGADRGTARSRMSERRDDPLPALLIALPLLLLACSGGPEDAATSVDREGTEARSPIHSIEQFDDAEDGGRCNGLGQGRRAA